MKAARIVDPAKQTDRSKVMFGATVIIADENDRQRTITIVGDDETDAGRGLIGWNAPMALALRGASIGDLRRITLPSGEIEYEVVGISYPEA
jgi:transcription elongation factor GreB